MKHCVRNQNLKLANINIQCLSNKINNLTSALASASVDIACVTEHWLKQDQLKSIHIKGYKIGAAFCRDTYNHGRVLIMVKNHLQIMEIDIGKHNTEKLFEICSIYITNIKAVVTTIYRPLNTDEEKFLSSLMDMVEEIKKLFNNTDIFIAGDYNIDLNENSTLTKKNY